LKVVVGATLVKRKLASAKAPKVLVSRVNLQSINTKIQQSSPSLQQLFILTEQGVPQAASARYEY
jgi:hypothetical protein